MPVLFVLALACDDPDVRRDPPPAATDPACVGVERSATFEGEDWSARLDGAGPVLLDRPGVLLLSGTWPSWLVVGADTEIRGTGAQCTVLTGEGVRQAIVVEEGRVVTIADLTVEAGEGEDGGGVVAPFGADLRIERATLRGNHARHQGGGLFAEGAGTVVLDDVTFEDNDADSAGGALFVRDAGVDVTGGSVVGNRAGTDGAGFRLHGSTATIDDTSFDANRSDDRGGALSVDNGAVVTGTGLVLTGNSAAERGGAVWVDDLAQLDLSGAEIVANDAGDGAGIAMRDGAVLTMTGSVLAGNTATRDGGGLHVVGLATAFVDDTTVEDNTAFDGAGLWAADEALVVLGGGVLRANVARGFGGGLATSSAAAVQVHGGEVARNVAVEGGGAFVGAGTVTCDGAGAWVSNEAQAGGAAVVFEGVLASSGCDFGVDARDNTPADVRLTIPVRDFAYGAGAIFSCDGLAADCTSE